MSANEPQYVVCYGGVFLMPEAVLRSLSAAMRNGFVYLRQDADTLTISSTRIADGRRRVLNGRVRAPMFRDATQLAIVNLSGAVLVMAVR